MAETVRPSRSRVWPVVAFLAMTIAASAIPASAQILYGSVVGIVKDSTGSVLPGATVTIVNKETNLTRETVTNADGVTIRGIRFRGLPMIANAKKKREPDDPGGKQDLDEEKCAHHRPGQTQDRRALIGIGHDRGLS